MSGNKRFLRSGKKSGSDDSVGNFVFSFPGTASPNQSLSFGGSAPTSPIGSPSGFGTPQPPSSPSIPTFGGGAAAPSSPTRNVFVFGAGASSTSNLPGSPQIGGNNTAPNSPNASLRRTFTDNTQSPSNTFGTPPLRRSNSDVGTAGSTFTFGSSTNTPSTPPSSTFSFGTGQNQPAPSTATATQPATGTSAFSFGSSAANASTTTSSSPFSFGSAPASGATSSTQGFASPAAVPSTPSQAPAAFSFGSTTSTPTTSTKPPVAPSTPSTGTSAFSFGSPATATVGSSGASPSFSVNSGSPAISFGTPPTAQKTDTNTTTTPSFSLKMPAPSTSASSSTSAPSPFGSAAAATTTTSTTTATSSAPTFAFSIPSTNNSKASSTPEKKDDTSKPTTPSSSLFSFGATPAKSTIPSVTTTTTTTTAAATTTSALPSFSTTTKSTVTPAITTPSAPNLFSFSTTLENLEKAARLPPNQIGAALITPSLNALRQNQIVTHTNFRIDNILPSTRFNELPEQARKELDELAQYINGESQRCDFIKNRAAPKQQETMKEAKHEYDILSYKLDSLSNSLQGQVNVVIELFELLREQAEHVNGGQSVLDASRHPGGRSASWLFGYGNTDDYFITLSTRLVTRMEEYKRCLREIEFTMESWTKNHAQSPQDIARIMTTQNQTFLALTNRVAALDETLKMEKDLYAQYRRQASAL